MSKEWVIDFDGMVGRGRQVEGRVNKAEEIRAWGEEALCDHGHNCQETCSATRQTYCAEMRARLDALLAEDWHERPAPLSEGEA